MNRVKVGSTIKLKVGGRETYCVVTDVSGETLTAKQCEAPDPLAYAFDEQIREIRRDFP